MIRDSFVFYRGFAEALKELDAETKSELMDALCDYALDGIMPECSGSVMAMFKLIKPQIDANNQRYENGKKGGRTKTNTEPKSENQEPNNNQNKTKTNQHETKQEPKPQNSEPNVNVNVNDNVNVNVNANKSPKEEQRAMVEGRNFSSELKVVVYEWLQYKSEKRQNYKPTGLKSLLTEISNNATTYGETAVISVIRRSMAAGYMGITWDWLKKEQVRNGVNTGSHIGSNARDNPSKPEGWDVIFGRG